MTRITYLLKYLLVITTVFVNVGCTTLTNKSVEAWPSQMPPESYFENYYAQDIEHQNVLSKEAYLGWVRRFYEGWALYSTGWLETTDELVKTLPTAEEQKIAREKMLLIGRLVSAEWAKNDKFRVINTRMLMIWGPALRESTIQGDQLVLLDRVLDDVESLLSGQITPMRIVDGRYYKEQIYENDPFAGT